MNDSSVSRMWQTTSLPLQFRSSGRGESWASEAPLMAAAKSAAVRLIRASCASVDAISGPPGGAVGRP